MTSYGKELFTTDLKVHNTISAGGRIETTGAFLSDSINAGGQAAAGTFQCNGTGVGFYATAPIAQGAAVANATDAASVITQLNLLLARMRAYGLIAPNA